MELGMVFRTELFLSLSFLEKCVLINIGKLKPFSNIYPNQGGS